MLPYLRLFYPAHFNRYIEPFVGSGAVFFDLQAAGRLRGKHVALIDSNADLIGCYEAVRDAPDAVAVFWIAGPMGEWRMGAALSIGVFLGLVNHLVTEYWLLRVISSGGQPSRASMVRSTIVRLAVLTVFAVGIAVLFWPEGVALLLGLAIFRLIALVMTGLPLLQELKELNH